ncbi:MAG: YHS domain-containing protein, partial [Sphingomicrobium sp.]
MTLADQTFAIDPVCGMKVDPARTEHHASFEGAEYLFCSMGCRSKFTVDPLRYLDHQAQIKDADHATIAEGTIWTCPMHP